MHTMHHRTSAAASATSNHGTASSSSSSSVQQLPSILPQRRRRKVGGSVVSSSSILSNKLHRISRIEFLIIIIGTCIMTMIIVLSGIKLYTSLSVTTDSSSNTNNNNNNGNRILGKLFERYKKNNNKDVGGNKNQKKKTKSQREKEQEDVEDDEDEEQDDDAEILPFNEIYTVPNSMTIVGDRSDRYVTLRQEYDEKLPPYPLSRDRSIRFVQELTKHNPYNHHSGIVQPAIQSTASSVHNSDAIVQTIPYDIYNCPEVPVDNYPYTWNLYSTILRNWSPDNTSIPDSKMIHHSICIFDYTVDYEKALNYRNAELPFIVINDPAVAETVERWNTPHYLQQLMGTTKHRTEYSENNHFMYYVPPPKTRQQRRGIRAGGNNNKQRGAPLKLNKLVPPDWKPPTQLLRMSYTEWIAHANITDDTMLGPDHPHWYYRLIGCGTTGSDGSCDTDSSEYLFDELTFFQPRRKKRSKKSNNNNNPNELQDDRESLYIVDPDEQKGIHCRFGMKGVIAENHFDGSRNAIVVLGGSRRYILAHPNQCEALCLYPKGHPSARHSAVDWSNPNIEEYPAFAKAVGNEVVLIAGQVLYLPTEWFHYIISLELNFQCNTRSGITKHYHSYIKQCGF